MAGMLRLALVVGAVLLGGFHAPHRAAADQTMVTLSVPDMTCLACPITVRKSLERVDGVIKAEAYLESQTAVVTYDPARTGVAALIEATTNYGYPSTVIGEGG